MPTNNSNKKLISDISTFADHLNSVCAMLNSIYDVNNGGCCYIAYTIADILEREDIPFIVVVDADDCYQQFKDYDDVHHIWIQIDTSDCKDTINIGGWESGYEYEGISSKDILNMYNNGNWNCMYDRAKNKFIKHIINELYENFSKSLREKQ